MLAGVGDPTSSVWALSSTIQAELEGPLRLKVNLTGYSLNRFVSGLWEVHLHLNAFKLLYKTWDRKLQDAVSIQADCCPNILGLDHSLHVLNSWCALFTLEVLLKLAIFYQYYLEFLSVAHFLFHHTDFSIRERKRRVYSNMHCVLWFNQTEVFLFGLFGQN